jgi:Fe-S-cluster containining protein
MSESKRLTRTSPFSYSCNRCMSCCHDAHIALTPYEITRLARSLQLRTTEFIARYLTDGGIVLRNHDGGACSMLGDASCNVYADRPLVCRTYPLLRTLGANGEEYVKFKPLPTTKGVYGEDGSVEEFLQAHEIAAFAAASDRYFEILRQIIEGLAGAVRSRPELFPTVRQTIDSHCEFRTQNVPELIDVDRVVAEFCRNRGDPVPTDIDKLIPMHILAIEEKAAALRDAEVVAGPASGPIDTAGAEAKQRQILELSALAGALGAATGARVLLLLAAAVLGKPAEFANERTGGPRFHSRS